MLIGEFETKITENKRLAVPKKFRDELKGKLILMNGYEGCLVLVNQERFLALTKDITEGKFINDSVRDISRFLVGSAHEIETDKQGRFVLPESLYEYAGLDDTCTFLGLYNWIEIWDKTKWEKRKKHIQKNANEISEKLNNSFKE